MGRYLLALPVLLGILFSFQGCVSGSNPEPDTSAECVDCENQVQKFQDTWTNETTVADILAEMQNNCKSYPFFKQKLCDKIAEVLVQIPPGLIEGMESLAWPIPEAVCATVRMCTVNCCAADAAPEQVHLSLASKDPSIMHVTWVSLSQPASVVQYGLSKDNLEFSAEGSLDTYTAAGWVGTIHRASMTSLQPSTTYYYRVGDGSSKWSEVFNFKTRTPGQTMTYAVIADMGYGSASDGSVRDLVNLVNSGGIDAVIHSGDISYADGYEPHWDVFLNKVEPIASRVPYMVVPGNHEFWYNFSAYKHRFTMPSEEDGSGTDNMYYSWEVEHVHFVAIDSESALDTPLINDAEQSWIEHNLESVDRSTTPWVMTHFHRPMYCSDDHGCGNGADYLRERAEDIFYENQVDLVLTGHVHSYERTYPMYKSSSTAHDYVTPTAPVYVLQGGSGNREGNKGSYPPPEELPEWSGAQHTNVGYGLLTVTADTLDWKFYASTVFAEDGSVKTEPQLLDQFTIDHTATVKNH